LLTYFGIFLIIFLLIVEFFCIMLRLTGLTEDKSKFQVISLLTASGFTTKESELITQHPKRRKIAQYLMILGYAGLATFISFLATILKNSISIFDLLKIIIFLIAVFSFAKSKFLMITLDNLLEKLIIKSRLYHPSVKNISYQLNQNHGYGIYQILIEKDFVFLGKTLKDSNFKSNYIQVLNIDKGNEFIPFPSSDYVIEKDDNLIVYGEKNKIVEIFKLK
jgi:hypothetical protein